MSITYKPIPEDPAELKARVEAVEKLLADAAVHMADIETAPPEGWWKRYFLYSGDHMILTEEGWEPGEGKESYIEQAKEDEMDLSEVIFDEVNAPPTA